MIKTSVRDLYILSKLKQLESSAGTYMKVRKVGTNTDTNIGGWTT